ncbi:MAG: hypothetical protein CMM37_00310 [Rhodospirillaceae bacterium]|nr:hypothetical protein [Rhodospirillaceae bacterium]
MNKELKFSIIKRLICLTILFYIFFIFFLENFAQSRDAIPAVVVTASRLDSDYNSSSLTGSIGALTTVITNKQIRQSVGQTIPEIISFEAGIQFQDLYGSTNGAGQTIDMRGFGEPATANTLILINGRRLTDLDLAAVDFSAIPRESIDRIEITRGNVAGVLYGGGAEGGAINIITKAYAKAGIHSKIETGFGSDNFRDFNFSSSHKKAGFSLSAYGNRVLSDGYRDNNYLKQKNLTLEVRRHLPRGDLFLNINLDDQKLGLPGGRIVDPSKDQNDLTNPRGAQTPNDYALENGLAAYLGGSYDINQFAELIIDGSFRRKDQDSDFRNQDQARDTVLTTWGLTPRILLDATIDQKKITSTMGFDFYYVDYNSDRKRLPNTAPFTRIKAYQYTTGLYNQSLITLNPHFSTSFGFRLDRISFQIGDTAYPNNPGSYGYPQTSFKPSLTETDVEYALNMGFEYKPIKLLKFYGHIGRSYRPPTLDERSGTAYALNNFELKNQSSKEIQSGVEINFGTTKINSRAYFSKTRDEIRFDPDGSTSFGANENTGPIYRYGLETTVGHKISKDIRIKGDLALIKAEFADGPFDGQDIPLVPNITASAGINWKIQNWINLNTAITYEGDRRLANDEQGYFSKLSDFTLWDLDLNGKYKSFTWSASINNLLDEDYQTFGTASDTTPGRYSVQTLPGRTYFLKLGFKL